MHSLWTKSEVSLTEIESRAPAWLAQWVDSMALHQAEKNDDSIAGWSKIAELHPRNSERAHLFDWWWLPCNPVREDDQAILLDSAIRVAPAGTTLVIPSGTLAEGFFEATPLNWMGAGYTTLIEWLRRVRTTLENRKIRLLLRPHARHVLSDHQIAQQLLRDLDVLDETGTIWDNTSPIGLFVSPIDLLEPSMLADQGDHLTRILTLLGPIAHGIYLYNWSVDSEFDVIAESTESTNDTRHEDQRVKMSEIIGPLVQSHISQSTPVVFPESLDFEDPLISHICNLVE